MTLWGVLGSPTAPGRAAPGASMVALTSHCAPGDVAVAATTQYCWRPRAVHRTSGGQWSLSVGGGGRWLSGVRRPAACRAVSRVGAVACSHCSRWFGSAGGFLSAGARRRRVAPRLLTLVSVSCVRAWPHSMGGIQTCWPSAC